MATERAETKNILRIFLVLFIIYIIWTKDSRIIEVSIAYKLCVGIRVNFAPSALPRRIKTRNRLNRPFSLTPTLPLYIQICQIKFLSQPNLSFSLSMATSVRNNFMPQSLIANLQQVLISRNDAVEGKIQREEVPPTGAPCSSLSRSPASVGDVSKSKTVEENDYPKTKPVVLVTNGEGVESPGLTLLVQALVRDARFDVHVCAPQS